MAGSALAIRTDLHTADDLRRLARRERDRRAAMRMLALANAMEGMYRRQFLGHRVEPYAAMAAGWNCF